MRRFVGPTSHVWVPSMDGLWRCTVCNGFVVSKAKPDHEAVAISEEEALAEFPTNTESDDVKG